MNVTTRAIDSVSTRYIDVEFNIPHYFKVYYNVHTLRVIVMVALLH